MKLHIMEMCEFCFPASENEYINQLHNDTGFNSSF